MQLTAVLLLISLMASAVSRRKQLLSVADSFDVSGGVSRVFTFPTRGILVITPSAQRVTADWLARAVMPFSYWYRLLY